MAARFENKVALVTGDGGGIGRAISRRHASEGAHVVVADAELVAAAVVAFLASGQARHATGSTIDITGADYVR